MEKQAYMSYEQYLVNVKKGIVTDQRNCPVTPLLQKLQGKWKAQVLYELCIHDPARFGEIKKDLPGIANATLSNGLKELEADGFVQRVQFNEIPPHVEYSFTEKGRDLMLIFYQIMVWGFKHENDERKAIGLRKKNLSNRSGRTLPHSAYVSCIAPCRYAEVVRPFHGCAKEKARPSGR